jgi:hypothetical protein
MKTLHIKFVAAPLLALAVGLTGTVGAQAATPAPTPLVIPESTLSHTGNAVTVKVSRLDAKDQVAFKVVLDTHSIDLDKVDLKTLAVLRSESGLELKPLSWTAPLGGHHREGTLAFASNFADGTPVLKDAKTLVLVIKNVAGVEERTFRWNLATTETKR